MFEKARKWAQRKTNDARDAIRERSETFNRKHDKRRKEKYSIGKHLGHGAFNAAMAGMVVGALPGERGDSVGRNLIDAANKEWNQFVERQALDKLAAYEEEMRLERKRSIEELVPGFHAQIQDKITGRQGDMTRVWLNAFSPDLKLEGKSRFEYLRSSFLLDSGSIPESAAASLRSFITSLVATESRFDLQAVSHTNAFGAVQAIPSTFRDWYKLGQGIDIPPDKYQEYKQSFVEDFAQQVEFMNWYFPYMYERLYADPGCKKELEEIQKQYFPGDEDAFNRYFIAPVLLNAYNAGFGTMKELIEGVGSRARSFRETHPHSIPHQKYLAFFLMTEDTDLRKSTKASSEGRYFDPEKHAYVREILAFDELISEMIKRGRPEIQLATNEAS